MNLQSIFQHEHDSLLELFDDLDRSSVLGRSRLVDLLEEGLAGHVGIRELLVHPLLRKIGAAALADAALAEHSEISRQLKRFRRIRPDDFRWGSALSDLWLTVEDHLMDEEAVVVPALMDGLSGEQLHRLEHHFASLQTALPVRVDGDDGAEYWRTPGVGLPADPAHPSS